ncbi:ribonuclease P protein component [Candidatus Uhrbacteria bacterium]|nr:ribonuclease P protein component [Candidatus Uhrbacteria bacterium]
MLARAQRLTEKRDFQSLFSRGMALSSPLYTMRWRKNFGSLSRFGFVVANTVSKKATQRNTIRRRFRECVRKHMGALPFSADIAIIVKQKALGAPFKEIEEEIVRSFAVIKRRAATAPPRPARHRPV